MFGPQLAIFAFTIDRKDQRFNDGGKSSRHALVTPDREAQIDVFLSCIAFFNRMRYEYRAELPMHLDGCGCTGKVRWGSMK